MEAGLLMLLQTEFLSLSDLFSNFDLCFSILSSAFGLERSEVNKFKMAASISSSR